MKIRPREVEGVPSREAEQLKGRKSGEIRAEDAGLKSGKNAADVTVSLDLSREINEFLTQAFDDNADDPERRKKIEELKKKYQDGKLSYDSTAVAESVLKELLS